MREVRRVTIDLSKPIQTVDGLKVEILRVYENQEYPLVGVYFYDGEWYPECWTKNGFYADEGKDHWLNLVEGAGDAN